MVRSGDEVRERWRAAFLFILHLYFLLSLCLYG
jgi:hypothetical protein